MNRKSCGYLVSQFRANPTRLNISLVLIKVHFSIRNSENFIKRRVADRWSQFLKSKISVFLSIQLLKLFIKLHWFDVACNFHATIYDNDNKKNDDWDFVSLSRHLLTNMRTYANSLFSFYSARELFWTWYGDRWEANAFSGLALFNSHQSLGETLFKCFKLDATNLISATHARGKDNSFCLPFLAYRVKAFVFSKNSLIMS